MDTTPRLQLPYIAPQQAQKQVTYNQAMRALDLLVQPAVKSRTLPAPPAGPAEGDAYVVAAGATGAWAGKDGMLAVLDGGAWSFRAAADGWQLYVEDSAELIIRRLGAWEPFVSNGGSAVAKFGINATADETNRLAVAAEASLFTHDGAGHRLKLNKAAAADTASVLFQAGFSGRAEFGLCGDDNFHLKVSPDGATWFEGLTIARATGRVALPLGQLAFPATQNPSSDPNTLDDYEEGSFTPAITLGGAAVGLSYAGTPMGRYTKIGNRVLFNLRLSLATKGSSTGDLVITGLPYISAALHQPVSAHFDGGSQPIPYAHVSTSTTTIALFRTSGTSAIQLTQNDVTNATTIAVGGQYEVA